MKKTLSLILSIFFLSLYSQNLKVTYNLSYNVRLDTIKNNNLRKDYENLLKNLESTYGILFIKQSQSVFEQQSNKKSNFITDYYTSVKEKKIYYKLSNEIFPDSDFAYKSFKEYNWKITKESKNINGFVCYKATAYVPDMFNKTNNLIAWFCPELPYSFGPSNYCGLPGLVFEAYNSNAKGEHWTLKSIDKSENISFKFPNVDKAINSSELLNKLENMYKDFKKQGVIK